MPSEPLTPEELAAYRARNSERRKGWKWSSQEMREAMDDVDALLASDSARVAEVERLMEEEKNLRDRLEDSFNRETDLVAEIKRLRAAMIDAAKMICDFCSEHSRPQQKNGTWSHLDGDDSYECDAPDIWEALGQ